MAESVEAVRQANENGSEGEKSRVKIVHCVQNRAQNDAFYTPSLTHFSETQFNQERAELSSAIDGVIEEQNQESQNVKNAIKALIEGFLVESSAHYKKALETVKLLKKDTKFFDKNRKTMEFARFLLGKNYPLGESNPCYWTENPMS